MRLQLRLAELVPLDLLDPIAVGQADQMPLDLDLRQVVVRKKQEVVPQFERIVDEEEQVMQMLLVMMDVMMRLEIMTAPLDFDAFSPPMIKMLASLAADNSPQ